MRVRPKQALVALVLALLFGFAFSPVFGVGPLGEDIAILDGAGSNPVAPADAGQAAVSRDRTPLEEASIAVDRSVLGAPSPTRARFVAAALRAENFLLLLASALCLGLFTRRLLLPWMGEEVALGAARATTVLFALHPVADFAAMQLSARGDLLALALASASTALFLRGRQDRRVPSALLAFLFAGLAGLASEAALGLPFLLFLAEVVSSHRYRPLAVRLRTGGTTLLGFCVLVAASPLVEFLRSVTVHVPEAPRTLARLVEPGGAAAAFRLATHKLGVLLLPVNPAAVGLAGIALAGVALLLALQPALVAARSAPRLWGWIGSLWLIVLLGSELLELESAILPGSLAGARSLLPSAAVMAVGLGIVSTALRGPRRPWMAWAVAVCFAILAHGNLTPLRAAARAFGVLEAELLATRASLPSAVLLVVDPPAAVAGVEPVGRALAHLPFADLHIRSEEARRADYPELLGLSRSAFLALVREPEWDLLEDRGVVASVPLASFAVDDLEHVEGPSKRAEGRRVARRLAPSGAAEGPRSWQGTLNSPPLSLAALREEAVLVRVPGSVDEERLGPLGWETTQEEGDPGEGVTPPRAPLPNVPVHGVWRAAGDESEALFDLGSSLAWCLSGRVRTLLFPRGTQSIESAEVLSSLPGVAPVGELVPRAEDGTWTFTLPSEKADDAGSEGRGDPEAVSGWSSFAPADGVDAGFVLGILRLSDLSFRSLPLELDGRTLRAPGDAPDFPSSPDGGLAWTLEYRVGGRAVARSRGRL